MKYKHAPLIKDSSIEFRHETTYFDDSNFHSIPLNIYSYLEQIDICIQNTDFTELSITIQDFTEKLRDEKYSLPKEYTPHSVSSVFLSLFDPYQKSEFLYLLIPFLLAWTSFQDVENSDFSSPEFFDYIMRVIENRNLDPNYDKIENYRFLFYKILNNLLIDSPEMRNLFISQNPIPLFNEIYSSPSKYYKIAFTEDNVNKVNELITYIMINALKDYNFSNQIPQSYLYFSNSLLNLYETYSFRFSNCFVDTKNYEFCFLQAFIQSHENHLIKFFDKKNFDVYEYFKNFLVLENNRIFPFLYILRSIFNNIDKFSDDVGLFIKKNIYDRIIIDPMIEYFQNHDSIEESLQYVQFLHSIFKLGHDHLNLFFNNFFEIERFQSFITEGYYKLRVKTLPLFHIFFQIDSDYYIGEILKKVRRNFSSSILDLIDDNDDNLTIQILEIFNDLLFISQRHHEIIKDVFYDFRNNEIDQIVDELKYKDDQSDQIVELCDLILDQFKENERIIINDENKKLEESLQENPLDDFLVSFDNSDYSDLEFWG